jgi:hypothetical protein
MKSTLVITVILGSLLQGCFLQGYTQAVNPTILTSSVVTLPKFSSSEAQWIKDLEEAKYTVTQEPGGKLKIESPIVESDDRHGLLQTRWSEQVKWEVWVVGDRVVGSYTVMSKPIIGPWGVKTSGTALEFKP